MRPPIILAIALALLVFLTPITAVTTAFLTARNITTSPLFSAFTVKFDFDTDALTTYLTPPPSILGIAPVFAIQSYKQHHVLEFGGDAFQANTTFECDYLPVIGGVVSSISLIKFEHQPLQTGNAFIHRGSFTLKSGLFTQRRLSLDFNMASVSNSWSFICNGVDLTKEFYVRPAYSSSISATPTLKNTYIPFYSDNFLISAGLLMAELITTPVTFTVGSSVMSFPPEITQLSLQTQLYQGQVFMSTPSIVCNSSSINNVQQLAFSSGSEIKFITQTGATGAYSAAGINSANFYPISYNTPTSGAVVEQSGLLDSIFRLLDVVIVDLVLCRLLGNCPKQPTISVKSFALPLSHKWRTDETDYISTMPSMSASTSINSFSAMLCANGANGVNCSTQSCATGYFGTSCVLKVCEEVKDNQNVYVNIAGYLYTPASPIPAAASVTPITCARYTSLYVVQSSPAASIPLIAVSAAGQYQYTWDLSFGSTPQIIFGVTMIGVHSHVDNLTLLPNIYFHANDKVIEVPLTLYSSPGSTPTQIVSPQDLFFSTATQAQLTVKYGATTTLRSLLCSPTAETTYTVSIFQDVATARQNSVQIMVPICEPCIVADTYRLPSSTFTPNYACTSCPTSTEYIPSLGNCFPICDSDTQVRDTNGACKCKIMLGLITDTDGSCKCQSSLQFEWDTTSKGCQCKSGWSFDGTKCNEICTTDISAVELSKYINDPATGACQCTAGKNLGQYINGICSCVDSTHMSYDGSMCKCVPPFILQGNTCVVTACPSAAYKVSANNLSCECNPDLGFVEDKSLSGVTSMTSWGSILIPRCRKNCLDIEVYDTATLMCLDNCGSNQEPVNGSCVCQSGYTMVSGTCVQDCPVVVNENDMSQELPSPVGCHCDSSINTKLMSADGAQLTCYRTACSIPGQIRVNDVTLKCQCDDGTHLGHTGEYCVNNCPALHLPVPESDDCACEPQFTLNIGVRSFCLDPIPTPPVHSHWIVNSLEQPTWVCDNGYIDRCIVDNPDDWEISCLSPPTTCWEECPTGFLYDISASGKCYCASTQDEWPIESPRKCLEKCPATFLRHADGSCRCPALHEKMPTIPTPADGIDPGICLKQCNTARGFSLTPDTQIPLGYSCQCAPGLTPIPISSAPGASEICIDLSSQSQCQNGSTLRFYSMTNSSLLADPAHPLDWNTSLPPTCDCSTTVGFTGPFCNIPTVCQHPCNPVLHLQQDFSVDLPEKQCPQQCQCAPGFSPINTTNILLGCVCDKVLNNLCSTEGVHKVSFTTTRCPVRSDFSSISVNLNYTATKRTCTCRNGYAGPSCQYKAIYLTLFLQKYESFDVGDVFEYDSSTRHALLSTLESEWNAHYQLYKAQNGIVNEKFIHLQLYYYDSASSSVVLEMWLSFDAIRFQAVPTVGTSIMSNSSTDGVEPMTRTFLFNLNSVKLKSVHLSAQSHTPHVFSPQSISSEFADLPSLWKDIIDDDAANQPVNGVGINDSATHSNGGMYDPQCVLVAPPSCTSSSPPNHDSSFDDEVSKDENQTYNSLLPSTPKKNILNSGFIISIVIPITFIILLFLVVIVAVSCCKAHQKYCFSRQKTAAQKDLEELAEAGNITLCQLPSSIAATQPSHADATSAPNHISMSDANIHNCRRDSASNNCMPGAPQIITMESNHTQGFLAQHQSTDPMAFSHQGSGHSISKDSISDAFFSPTIIPSQSDGSQIDDDTDPLPPGWIKQKHVVSGRTFFLNLETLESRWNHPNEDGAVSNGW